MSKWFGKIGFALNVEVDAGLWQDTITERTYYGEVLTLGYRMQAGESINDDIMISNRISIISDPFANGNFYSIRYVEYAGAKWKVTNVEVAYPRLILTLGGVYNGEVEGTSSNPSSNTWEG